MPTPQAGAERRRFSRIDFHRPAELTVGEASAASCGVLDLSLAGALVEVPAGFAAAPGDRCRLRVHLGLGTCVEMDGVVVHRRAGTLGVRCTGIDLDGISHLRRLVELNLGDRSQLLRELGALVGR